MAGRKIPEPVAEVYRGHHLSGYRPGGFSSKPSLMTSEGIPTVQHSPSCSPARRAGCFLRAGEVSAPRGKVIKFDPGSYLQTKPFGEFTNWYKPLLELSRNEDLYVIKKNHVFLQLVKGRSKLEKKTLRLHHLFKQNRATNSLG
jgi:hypothetical protein